MDVVILRPLEWADAGQARVLSVGVVYDLPETVARAFVSAGWAAAAVMAAPLTRECAVAAPSETGHRRKRR